MRASRAKRSAIMAHRDKNVTLSGSYRCVKGPEGIMLIQSPDNRTALYQRDIAMIVSDRCG
jgi:hypothetical protein